MQSLLYLLVLPNIVNVLVPEVSCDLQNERRLLEEYDRLQRIPSAAKSSRELQNKFITSETSRLKRQLRGNYDIIYVIDSSSSISRAEFRKGIKAIEMLIDRGAPASLHAVITVASHAYVALNFTSGEVSIDKLQTLQRTGGKTNMQEALRKCKQLFRNPASGARVGSFRRVLVITDGQSNVKREQTLRNAMELKLDGAEVFVVAVGEYVEGIDELIFMASSFDAHLYRAGNMQGLVEIVKLIPSVSHRRNWVAEVLRLRDTFISGRRQ